MADPWMKLPKFTRANADDGQEPQSIVVCATLIGIFIKLK
jgi:hypothetical protein